MDVRFVVYSLLTRHLLSEHVFLDYYDAQAVADEYNHAEVVTIYVPRRHILNGRSGPRDQP